MNRDRNAGVTICGARAADYRRDHAHRSPTVRIDDGAGYFIASGRTRSCAFSHGFSRRSAVHGLRRASGGILTKRERRWSRLRRGGERSLFGRERQCWWSPFQRFARTTDTFARHGHGVERTSQLFAASPFEYYALVSFTIAERHAAPLQDIGVHHNEREASHRVGPSLRWCGRRPRGLWRQ
jgi:hypothetical protein